MSDFLGPLREEAVPADAVAAVRRGVSEGIRRGRGVPWGAVAAVVAVWVAGIWWVGRPVEEVPLPEPVVAAMPKPEVVRVVRATVPKVIRRRAAEGAAVPGTTLRVTAVTADHVELRGSDPNVLIVLMSGDEKENEQDDQDAARPSADSARDGELRTDGVE